MTSTSSYPTLLDALRDISSTEQTARTHDRERRKVDTYWHMGDAIHTHVLDHEGRTQYGDQVVDRLAQDLSMDRSLLYLILQFRQSFPMVNTYRQLHWSHFRTLLPLETRAAREFYAQAANARNWSVRELMDGVREDLFGRYREVGWSALEEEAPIDLPPLQPLCGQLYTYRLVPAGPDLPISAAGSAAAVEFMVDLGFGIRWSGPLLGLEDACAEMAITSVRQRLEEGESYRFQPAADAERQLYTYVARVDRVVDGDTLLVTVDCGFRIACTQRLRLRSVDAPELSSVAGQRARAYVEQVLGAIDFVIVATHRTDRYGRYLADVRYLPGTMEPEVVLEEGRLLNQELLDRGVVRPYL
jgi:endonuclease YncB( thermonuclease family)